MFHTAKHTLQKFTTKYKAFQEKRKPREKKHFLKPEQKEKLVAFLNRYSLIFHYLLACSICFTIETISRHSFVHAFIFIQLPDCVHITAFGVLFPKEGADADAD